MTGPWPPKVERYVEYATCPKCGLGGSLMVIYYGRAVGWSRPYFRIVHRVTRYDALGYRTCRQAGMSPRAANRRSHDQAVTHYCHLGVTPPPIHRTVPAPTDRPRPGFAKVTDSLPPPSSWAKHHLGHPKGEHHPKARLSAEEVRELRRLHGNGLKQSELAARYRISWSTVHDIVTGKHWQEGPRRLASDSQHFPLLTCRKVHQS